MQRKASDGTDVAGVGPVPAQMWQGWAQSRRRCGRGEPSPGADVEGVSPVPAQTWKGFSARSWCRRRRGELACERAGAAAEALAQFESATVAPLLLAHVRSRDWLPVPQVTEQAPHGPAAYLLEWHSWLT